MLQALELEKRARQYLGTDAQRQQLDAIAATAVGYEQTLSERDHYEALKRKFDPDAISFHGGQIRYDRRNNIIDGFPDRRRFTSVERSIIERLFQDAGQFVHTNDILQALSGPKDIFIDPRSLRTHIRNTRKKIEPNPEEPTIVLGARNLGYMLNGIDPVDDQPVEANTPLQLPRVEQQAGIQISEHTSFFPGRASVMVNGTERQLTQVELRLLTVLLDRGNSIVPKHDIGWEVWGDAGYSQDSIRVAIYSLRNKLESDPRKPLSIVTVPGRGYILNISNK